MRASDGEALWQVALEERVRVGVAVGEDLLFAGTNEGTLLALALADGDEKWRQELGEALRSRPLPAGDRVFTATASGKVVAVASDGGAVLWQQALGGLLTEDLAVGAGTLVADRLLCRK